MSSVADDLSRANLPYRTIVEQMVEGAATVSRHGILIFVNPGLAAMLGREPAELVGMAVSELVVEQDRPALADLITLQPGERRSAELELATEHGPLPTKFTAGALDVDGTQVVCLVVTDLTARQKEAATLHESEQRLARVIGALPVGIYITDRDGRSLYSNLEALRLVGLPEMPDTATEVAEALTVVEDGTERPYPLARWPLTRALAGESAHALDMEIHDEPDQVVPLEVWGTPVFDSDGDVEFAIVTLADITERKRAQQVMAGQAAMLDLAHDAVVVWKPNGRITYWNNGAEATYGYSREQAVGAKVHDLLQTQLPRPQDELLQLVEHDGKWEGELEQRRADGSRVVVASRWAQHVDLNGSFLGVMEINRDVTARVDAEAALARRAAELELANRDITRSNEDLEQFAYVASHDLAEPLRAIWLPLSMLARRYEGQLGADADEYIGFAVDGCLRMQKMIDDLLRWSRVGRIEEAIAPVDCAVVVNDALTDLQQAVADTGAEIIVGPLPTVPAVRGQVTQIFQNLISNALKFVEPAVTPHIEVAAERQNGTWRFTVTDNGIGIEPKQRERIFGMFKRLHPRDEYPGTGIGLALAKKAVERHSGSIGVEDTASGTGARFWFTLPAAQPDEE